MGCWGCATLVKKLKNRDLKEKIFLDPAYNNRFTKFDKLCNLKKIQ